MSLNTPKVAERSSSSSVCQEVEETESSLEQNIFQRLAHMRLTNAFQVLLCGTTKRSRRGNVLAFANTTAEAVVLNHGELCSILEEVCNFDTENILNNEKPKY